MAVTPDVLSQLYHMAQASPKREICGIITDNLEIIPILNSAKTGEHFVMQKSSYLRALNRLREEGKGILAIYHSHPSGDLTPSAEDIIASRRTGHNYLIVTSNAYCWVEV